MLDSEIWDENFVALLSLAKKFIVDAWEVRKKLCCDESCPGQLHSQSSAGDLGPVTGVRGL